MIVGHHHHERADERTLALIESVGNNRFELVLHPGADRSQWLGQTQRRPILLSMEQVAELVLQRVVSDRSFLADEDDRSGRQRSAQIDRPPERV